MLRGLIINSNAQVHLMAILSEQSHMTLFISEASVLKFPNKLETLKTLQQLKQPIANLLRVCYKILIVYCHVSHLLETNLGIIDDILNTLQVWK